MPDPLYPVQMVRMEKCTVRIFLVITGLGVGGAERQVCDLADGFVRLGHIVKLVYLTGSVAVKPVSTKVEIRGLGLGKSPVSLWRALAVFKSEVEAFKPDVVHSHMFHANIFARFARLNCAMPRLISTAHNTSEGGRFRSLLYRVTDYLADISTNVSDEAVEAFVSDGAAPRGRMVVVYNGIDLSRFDRVKIASQSSSDGDLVLLAVGRLYPQKDYPNLLRAFRLLPSTSLGRKLRLDIVGDGPERSKLEALAKKLGVEDRVRFLGVRSDVPSLMKRADIFVLSSAWEGFGLVVAEAMACGRRVVATDCGGVAEVLGDNGVLVAPHDCEKLAQGIREALAMSPDESERLGDSARRHVEQTFSMDAVLSRWEELYAAGAR